MIHGVKTATPSVVEVLRGDIVESVHCVSVAVADESGRLVASAGDPGFVTFVRSAIKAFQALPLVEGGGVDRFGLTREELAVTCASHNSEPFHVAAARSILLKAGVTENALACGPHPPMHAPSADALREAGVEPSRIHNNCSGKHAGLLALARLHGWPFDGYHLIEHPVQQRILATLAQWSGMRATDIGVAVDGCGLPTFAMPLREVAVACARLSAAARDASSPPGRVIGAMLAHPEFVAGTNRLCSDLMRASGGRVWAKVGAEGYYCAGAPREGLGIAIKVEDGTWRAVEPALISVLRQLDLLSDHDVGLLQRYAEPAVLNTRNEQVGAIRAAIGLERTAHFLRL
jgi:L-asparaginase II